MDVFEGGDLSKSTGTTWGHIALIDDLDQKLKRLIGPMNPIEPDRLSVALALTSSMRAMRYDVAQHRTASAREAVIEWGPSPTL